MITRFIILIVFFISNFHLSGNLNTIILPDLINPDSIAIDHDQIYITEGTNIYIYDLSNFDLKKKFGKTGEGPSEFMVNRQSGNPPLTINVDTDKLIINSKNKVSLFSKNGQFIEEIRTDVSSSGFIPFLEGFIGESLITENGKRYWVLELYNHKIKKSRELIRIEHHFQGLGKGFKVLQESRLFRVSKEKLFVAWHKNFAVDVYNSQGNKIYSITHDYNRKAVTARDKNGIIKYFKTNPKLKEIYPLLKPIYFPDYYPAIRNMAIDRGKLFFVTYKTKNFKTECMVFELNGKFINTILLDLKSADIFAHYPYTIKQGKLYQLIETDDGEWRLRIYRI